MKLLLIIVSGLAATMEMAAVTRLTFSIPQQSYHVIVS